ncbi:kinase-like protein [Auriscalpium vulgare]|uniref:Kinase-like protein n=1 Tax=Auriscalpium vulgare TaxID=40419 RepID=A0ACB8SE04_9AGAM|nr:kinase-like protein [Auriscalpium vulgare]
MVDLIVLEGVNLSFSEEKYLRRLSGETVHASVAIEGELKFKTNSILYDLELSWEACLEIPAHPWSTVAVTFYEDKEPSGPFESSKIAEACFQASNLSRRSPLIAFRDGAELGHVFLQIQRSVAAAVSRSDTPMDLSLPVSLEEFLAIERYEGPTDPDDVWKRMLPSFSSRGLHILFPFLPPNGGCSPFRPSSLPPPEDPFQPTETEAFIYSTDPNRRIHWMNTRNVRHAYDRHNRLVVIKVVEKDSEEINILRFLNSPSLRSDRSNHTIPLLDVIEATNCTYIIEPAWELEPFHTLLWQVDDYFNITIQTLEALSFMHENRVFYRDFSTFNIVGNHDKVWLSSSDLAPTPIISKFDMRVGIIDFGFSKQFPLDTPLTECVANEYCGTMDFIAPEITASAKGGDHEGEVYQLGPADIYGLGATALKALEHERNFVHWHEDYPRYNGGTHAVFVLDEVMPEYQRLLEELVDADPLRRPSASSALKKFQNLRDRVPQSVLYAPEGGYPKDLSGLREGLAVQVIKDSGSV